MQGYRSWDSRSTPLTHSESLSSLVSIASASTLFVLDNEAIRGVPVTRSEPEIETLGSLSLTMALVSAPPNRREELEMGCKKGDLRFSIDGRMRSPDTLRNLTSCSSIHSQPFPRSPRNAKWDVKNG